MYFPHPAIPQSINLPTPHNPRIPQLRNCGSTQKPEMAVPENVNGDPHKQLAVGLVMCGLAAPEGATLEHLASKRAPQPQRFGPAAT